MMAYRNLLTISLILWIAGCATAPIEFHNDSSPQSVPLAPLVNKKEIVIGLALGGGATRGFAHIGVLNILEENGIIPDIVVGTSAGAVTGVLYSGGIRGARLTEVAQQLQRDQIIDWSYSGRGFIRGDLLQDYINNLLGNRLIDDFATVFAATATDLENGRLVIFTKGDAGLAIRASSAIPGLVSPVTINGRDYVDGGLVSKIPVHVARELGADIVIAVDVSRAPKDHLNLNNTLSVMKQAIAIMSQAVIEKDLIDADVVIRPEIGAESFGNFDSKDQVMNAGKRAAIKALPKIRQLINQQNRFEQNNHRSDQDSASPQRLTPH